MKIIGTMLTLTGGIVAFISSLTLFFEERFMHHFTYNQINPQNSEVTTLLGLVAFLTAIIAIILTLFSSKYRYPNFFFIVYIILGTILLILLPLLNGFFFIMTIIAGLLIISGGIVGNISR